jgi:hypothetical protein
MQGPEFKTSAPVLSERKGEREEGRERGTEREKEEGEFFPDSSSSPSKRFLQNTSKNKGYSWMGLSDLKHEGIWHWVDGSPLSPR